MTLESDLATAWDPIYNLKLILIRTARCHLMFGCKFMMKVSTGNYSLEFVHHDVVLLVSGRNQILHVLVAWLVLTLVLAPIKRDNYKSECLLSASSDLINDYFLCLRVHRVLIHGEIGHP